MSPLFLALALAMMPNAESDQSPPLATGTGTQKTNVQASIAKQSSQRVWVLRTKKEWKAFRESATLDEKSSITKRPIDFDVSAVIVVRNEKFYNRIRLGKAVWNQDTKTLQAMVAETRSARPIRDTFCFAAIVVPKDIASARVSGKTHKIVAVKNQ